MFHISDYFSFIHGLPHLYQLCVELEDLNVICKLFSLQCGKLPYKPRTEYPASGSFEDESYTWEESGGFKITFLNFEIEMFDHN